ncbi:hypothetical protein HPK19_11885 [Arthrobacter citreus]|nr:hypothetical protein HPK19_11885 [Arthrobacter citreus]
MNTSIIPNDNTKLKAALMYAEKLKWPVIPLIGKVPIVEGGYKSATTEPYIIENWWRNNPNANIGIPTGKVTGFFAVDIDPRNDGHLTQIALFEQYGAFPHTVEAITGGGGIHYLFKYPNKQISGKNNKFQGIDIKADGGYIVVSPSTHDSGKTYSWKKPNHPLNTPIADAPDWLLQALVVEENKKISKPSSHWLEIIKGADDGCRNDSAAQFAGYLIGSKLDPKVAWAIFCMWNERNNPPLSEQRMVTTFDSMMKREASKRKW